MLDKILVSVFCATLVSVTLASSRVLMFNTHETVDPELAPYVQDVKDMSKGSMGHVKYMGFITEKPRKDSVLAGRCEPIYPVGFQISINRPVWDSLNQNQRFVLIAHELYHCECDSRGHNDNKDSLGCAKYYMGPRLPDIRCARNTIEEFKKQISLGCNLRVPNLQ